MQGFYISNVKKDETMFEKVKKLLSEKEDTPEIPGFCLRIFYKNHHLSYYEKNGNFVANNGVFIYKDYFNKAAVKMFYEDLTAGRDLKELLLKAHGQFFLVIYLNGKLMVITDRFLTIPLYMLRWKNTIEISNIYYLLTQNSSVNYSVNFDHLAQSFSWQHNTYQIFTDGTLYHQIVYLKPGCIYSLEKGLLKEDVYYDIKRDINLQKYTSHAQILDDLVDILDSNYKFLDNVDRIFCDVTGGFDTRLNLNTLLKKNKQFKCGNDILKSEVCLTTGRYSDGEITTELCRIYKLNFMDIGKDVESVMKWIRENDEHLEVLKNSTMGSPHRMYYLDFVSKISDIELSGWAGSEILTKTEHLYYRKKKKFNVKEFLKRQKYVSVLSDKFYNKQRYYETLENYCADLIDNISYSKRGNLSTYVLYVTAFMNNQNKYFGSINMLGPVYSPYFEPDIIKLMMEIPYKFKGFHKIQRLLYNRIMDKRLQQITTTHGYPATTIKLNNFYRFSRLLNPVQPNVDYRSLFDLARAFYATRVREVLLPYIHWHLTKPFGLNKIDNLFDSVIDRDDPLRAYLDDKKVNNILISVKNRDKMRRLAKNLKNYF